MGRDTAGLLRKTRTEEKQRKRKKGRGKREGARRAFGGKKRGTEEIAGRGGHHLELGKRSFSKTLLHHLPIYTHCFVVCLG